MSDLVNVKDCSDLVAGIDGKPQRCVAIGDLPVTAVSDAGDEVSITLKNVRCVPSFSDSLLSVSALWESSSTECCFADVNAIHTPPSPQGERLLLPFYTEGADYSNAESSREAIVKRRMG
eukprot:6204818-Pleurochrysis_carterae.AAC.1